MGPVKRERSSHAMISELDLPQKLFTLEEASRTLPLVSRILRDIVNAYSEIERRQRRMLEASTSGIGEPAVAGDDAPGLSPSGAVVRAGDEPVLATVDLDALAREVEELQEELRSYEAELRQLGCVCKDPREGLVDFPAELDGRVVFLCWKLGEDEIGHWHEVDAGFAGRQTVGGVFTS